VIAAAIGRRRRFALEDERVARVRRALLELDPTARPEQRITCYLDRLDGSLVAGALSRPWACLELSGSVSLDRPDVWELTACRTRGPTVTQARLRTPAALLPAVLRGEDPPPRGDGTDRAARKLAAWRTFHALRGAGPLVPSLVVFAERLEVRPSRAVLVLETARIVSLASLNVIEDAAAGLLPRAAGGELPAAAACRLQGGVLEVQLSRNLPPAVAALVEGRESLSGSAFAAACAAVFPAGGAGGVH
jgi:hypothetical protein